MSYSSSPYDYAAAAAAMEEDHDDGTSQQPQSRDEKSRPPPQQSGDSRKRTPHACAAEVAAPAASSQLSAAGGRDSPCRPSVTISVQPPALPSHAVSYLSTADRSNADSVKTDVSATAGAGGSSVMPTLSPISAFTSSEEGNAMHMDRALSNSTARGEPFGQRQLTSSSSMCSEGSLRHLPAYPRSERLATRTLAEVGRNSSLKQMSRDDSFINIPSLDFVSTPYPGVSALSYPADVLARRQSSDGLNLASQYFATKMQQMAPPMSASSMLAVAGGGHDVQMQYHQLVHSLQRPHSPAAVAAPRERTAMERKLSINSLLSRMVNSGSSGTSPHDGQPNAHAGVPLTYTAPTASRRISQPWHQQQPGMQPHSNQLYNNAQQQVTSHVNSYQQVMQPQSHQITRAVLAGPARSQLLPAAAPTSTYHAFNYLVSPTNSPPGSDSHAQQQHHRASTPMMMATAPASHGSTSAASGAALSYNGHTAPHNATQSHAQPQSGASHSPHHAVMVHASSPGRSSPHHSGSRAGVNGNGPHLPPASPTPSQAERAATAAILQSAQRLKPPTHTLDNWSNDGLGRLASVSSETFTMQFGQREGEGGEERHGDHSRHAASAAQMHQQPANDSVATHHSSSALSSAATAGAAPASPHPSTGTGVLSEIINYEVPNADIRHPDNDMAQPDDENVKRSRSRKESFDSTHAPSSEGSGAFAPSSAAGKFQTGDDFVCTWCGKSGVIGTAKLMRREKVDAIKRTARPRWAEHEGRKIRVCNSCGIYFGRNKCLPPLDPNGKEAAGQQARLRRYFEEQATTQPAPSHHATSAAPKSPAKKEGRAAPRTLRSTSVTGTAMPADAMQPPSGALIKSEDAGSAALPARRQKRTMSDAFLPTTSDPAAGDLTRMHPQHQHQHQQQQVEHSRSNTYQSSPNMHDASSQPYNMHAHFNGDSMWHSHHQPSPHSYPHQLTTAYAMAVQPAATAQTQLDLLHQATVLPAHIQQAYTHVSNHYSPGHPLPTNAGGPPPQPSSAVMASPVTHGARTLQQPQSSPSSSESIDPPAAPSLNHQQSLTGHTMNELSNLSVQVQQMASADTAAPAKTQAQAQPAQSSGKSTPFKPLPTESELQLFSDVLREAMHNREALIALYQCGCLTTSLQTLGNGRKHTAGGGEPANGQTQLPPYSSQLLHSSPKRRFLPPPSSQLAYSHPSLSIDLAATHLINQQNQPTLSRGLVSPTPLRPAPTLPTGRTLSATSVGSLHLHQHHLQPHNHTGMSLHGHLSSSPSAAIDSFMQATPTADSQPPAHHLSHANSSTQFNTLHSNSANNALTPPATTSSHAASANAATQRFPQFPDTPLPKTMVR